MGGGGYTTHDPVVVYPWCVLFAHLASEEAKFSPDIAKGLLAPASFSGATGIMSPARDLHNL